MKNNWFAAITAVGMLCSTHAMAGEEEPFIYSTNGSSYSTEGVRQRTREQSTPKSFITENYAEIKVDAAKGKGDYLDVAAQMMISDVKQRAKFKKALKKKHKKIFKYGRSKGTKKVIALAAKYDK